MKYLIIVLLSASLACAHNLQTQLSQDVLSKINWEGIIAEVEKEIKALRSDSVQADVTNFTLELLDNLGDFINGTALDPLALPDEQLNLFPGSLKITNGTINDLHTITATSKVIVKYTHDTGVLELTLPIGFDDLVIKYKYKVTVLLVSVSGTLTAKVTNLKLNLHVGFNFSEYHAFVDKVDVKNSGSISFTFTGLGPLDYLIDILANALTTLFHGIILGVIDAVIYDPVSSVVDTLNDVIDSILHPNSTTILNYRF